MSQANMLPKEIQIPLHVDTSELDVALEKASQLAEKTKEAEKIVVDIETKTQNQLEILSCYARKLDERMRASGRCSIEKKIDSEKILERDYESTWKEFNKDPLSFVVRETVKIFCKAQDDKTALEALKILFEGAKLASGGV